jgi:hypothetical protein
MRACLPLVLAIGIGACGSSEDTPGSASGSFGGDSTGTGGGSNPDAGAGGADPARVFLSTHVAPALKTSCAVSGCHDAETKEHGLDLSSAAMAHASLVGQTTTDHCRNDTTVTRVVPGQPENSFVLVMVEGIDRCADGPRMPPPPRQMLSSTEIGLMRSWIAAGAKND